MNVIYNLKLSCSKCTPAAKLFRACTEKNAGRWKISGESYDLCPRRLITDQTWQYISAYKLYSKNSYPNGIGWLNESHKYLDAMILIESEVSKIDSIEKQTRPSNKPRAKYKRRPK